MLNSLFPRLSSNYFSREAKKKKKKLWRSSIPFGNERERVKGERETAERGSLLLLEGMRFDRKATVTSRALDRPRGDPCFLSKTVYRIIRLSRQAAVLHQNSSGPLIHFRILVHAFSFLREAGGGKRDESRVHALYFRLFFARFFFKLKRFSFRPLHFIFFLRRFFIRVGQVYICYVIRILRVLLFQRVESF